MGLDDSNLVINKICKYLIRFPEGAGTNDLVHLNITYFKWINPVLFMGEMYDDNMTQLKFNPK